MIPAIAPRAVAKNSGLEPIIAIRVAGNEPAKIATPIKPLSQPKLDREVKGIETKK